MDVLTEQIVFFELRFTHVFKLKQVLFYSVGIEAAAIHGEPLEQSKGLWTYGNNTHAFNRV